MSGCDILECSGGLCSLKDKCGRCRRYKYHQTYPDPDATTMEPAYKIGGNGFECMFFIGNFKDLVKHRMILNKQKIKCRK